MFRSIPDKDHYTIIELKLMVIFIIIRNKYFKTIKPDGNLTWKATEQVFKH